MNGNGRREEEEAKKKEEKDWSGEERRGWAPGDVEGFCLLVA
jgi:hypothetical protein